MLKTEMTSRQRALALVVVALVLVAVAVTGLLLREHAPGNMGNGFLSGAGVGIVAALIMGWRVTRAPSRATSFERAYTLHGDERDDAILTHALALLGLLSLPLTGVAGIAMGFGADPMMCLVLLMGAEALTGIIAFAVYSRRS